MPAEPLVAIAARAGLGLLMVLVAAAASVLHGPGAAAGLMVVPLYSTLRREELFRVSARDAIYQAIRSWPGINVLAIRERTAIGDGRPALALGTLAHHLRHLERFGFVVSKREGRFRRYFDAASGLGADAACVALLRTAPLPVVARTVLERPNLNQSELLEALSSFVTTRQALAYHLRRLVRTGLVAVGRVGRSRRYRPTDRLARLAGFVDSGPGIPPVWAPSGLLVGGSPEPFHDQMQTPLPTWLNGPAGGCRPVNPSATRPSSPADAAARIGDASGGLPRRSSDHGVPGASAGGEGPGGRPGGRRSEIPLPVRTKGGPALDAAVVLATPQGRFRGA